MNKQNISSFEKQLSKLPSPAVSPDAIEKTVADVRRQASIIKNETTLTKSFINHFSHFSSRTSVAVAAFIFGIIISGTFFSSAVYAQPGSWLYPIKLISEKIAFVLQISPEGKAELHVTYSEARMKELIKQYNLTNKVDKKIVELLLTEAQNAIKTSRKLDSSQQENINQRIKSLTEKQVQLFNEWEKKASDEEKPLYRNYAERCRQMHVSHHGRGM